VSKIQTDPLYQVVGWFVIICSQLAFQDRSVTFGPGAVNTCKIWLVEIWDEG